MMSDDCHHPHDIDDDVCCCYDDDDPNKTKNGSTNCLDVRMEHDDDMNVDNCGTDEDVVDSDNSSIARNDDSMDEVVIDELQKDKEENDYNNVIQVGCSYSYYPGKGSHPLNACNTYTCNPDSMNDVNCNSSTTGSTKSETPTTSSTTASTTISSASTATNSNRSRCRKDIDNSNNNSSNTSMCDVSRLTVNTHTSILNITEEEEDEEEDDCDIEIAGLYADETNFLFGNDTAYSGTSATNTCSLDCRLSPPPPLVANQEMDTWHPSAMQINGNKMLKPHPLGSQPDTQDKVAQNNEEVLSTPIKSSSLLLQENDDARMMMGMTTPVRKKHIRTNTDTDTIHNLVYTIIPETPPQRIGYNHPANRCSHHREPVWASPIITTTLTQSPLKNSNDRSFVDHVMDQFVEGLFCVTTTNKVSKQNRNNSASTTTTTQNTTSADNDHHHQYRTTDLFEGYHRLLEYDILILLGCTEPPEQDEMDYIWGWPDSYFNHSNNNNSSATTSSLLCPTADYYNPWQQYYSHYGQPIISLNDEMKQNANDNDDNKTMMKVGPQRLSWKQRCVKVHRIRQERNFLPVETGPLLTMSPVLPPKQHRQGYYNHHHRQQTKPSIHLPTSKELSLISSSSPRNPTAATSKTLLFPRTSRSFDETSLTNLHNTYNNKNYALGQMNSNCGIQASSNCDIPDDGDWYDNDEILGYDTDPEVQLQCQTKQHFSLDTIMSPSSYRPDDADDCHANHTITTKTTTNGKLPPILPDSFSPVMPTTPPWGQRTITQKLSRRRRQKQRKNEKIEFHSMIVQQVQETFNLTWTLTWYNVTPPKASSSSLQTTATARKQLHPKRQDGTKMNNSNYCKPVVCKVWMERGTLVRNNTLMIEPSLKWRQAYPTSLSSSSTASTTSSSTLAATAANPFALLLPTQHLPQQQNQQQLSAFSKPHSLPLLKICRILPAEECHKWTSGKETKSNIRKALGMVPLNRCIIIRCSNQGTCNAAGKNCGNDIDDDEENDEVYIFETASNRIREDLMKRWKTSIARFAALAVLEDVDSILKEFFNTQSLIPTTTQSPVVQSSVSSQSDSIAPPPRFVSPIS